MFFPCLGRLGAFRGDGTDAFDLARVRAGIKPFKLHWLARLRSTNDLRLALGVRLDVTEETEPPEEMSGEEDHQLLVYYWLTALQGSLVDALADGRGARR